MQANSTHALVDRVKRDLEVVRVGAMMTLGIGRDIALGRGRERWSARYPTGEVLWPGIFVNQGESRHRGRAHTGDGCSDSCHVEQCQKWWSVRSSSMILRARMPFAAINASFIMHRLTLAPALFWLSNPEQKWRRRVFEDKLPFVVFTPHDVVGPAKKAGVI